MSRLFKLDYIPDPDRGRPLWDAKIYIGVPNEDPTVQANQLDLTGDIGFPLGGVISVPQPVRTNNGGVTVYNNSPVLINNVGQSFAIAIYDRYDNLVYNFPNVDGELALNNSAQEQIVGGFIYPEVGVLDDGLIVPSGTTHLRVLVGGNPAIVEINPVASGVVSLLTEVGATIGGTPVNFTSIRFGKFTSIENAKSAIGIKVGDYVETYKYYDDLNGGSAVYQLVTPATFGGTPDELADHTHFSGNILQLVYAGPVSIEQCGARNVAGFDSHPSFLSAWAKTNVINAEKTGSYYLSSELVYPGNAYEFNGVQSAPFSSNTTLRPLDNTFSDVGLIDMNENGSDSGLVGGQFNKLRNVTVFGGMADWMDPLDPLVNLIGVRGVDTIDECNMENVSFRNCGKPFEFTGFKHNHKSVYIYQCHAGPDFESTNSSSINEYQIQTCYLNWGTYSGVNIHNATVQQGNEQQRLQDDIGMTCDHVNFTGYLYTEGGNAQIKVADSSTVTVENWEMGFAILLSGAFGNHNISVGTDSRIIVKGGKSSGVKSFLVGGSISSAKEIHLDIEPYDGRIYNSPGSVELPYIDDLFIKRTYGTIKRTDKYNEITLPQYAIGITTVTLWDQFITPNSSPFGGKIEVQVSGNNSYDRYEVDFADAPSQTEQVTINTIFRNVGGSGDNNIILSYVSPDLIAQGRQSDQRVSVKVSGYGSMWPKPIA